jgi:hypothetical protein
MDAVKSILENRSKTELLREPYICISLSDKTWYGYGYVLLGEWRLLLFSSEFWSLESLFFHILTELGFGRRTHIHSAG